MDSKTQASPDIPVLFRRVMFDWMWRRVCRLDEDNGWDLRWLIWKHVMFFKDCYKGLNKFISKTHTHNADILLMFYETRCVDIFFVKIVQKTWKTISCIRNDRSILLDFQNNNVSSMCEKFSVKFSGKFETKCSYNIIFLQKLNISHISLIFYRWPKNNC